jgi:hypothetical protein
MTMVLTGRTPVIFPQVIGRFANVVLFDDSHCQVHVDLQIVNVDMAPRRSLSRFREGAQYFSARIHDRERSRIRARRAPFSLPAYG